MEAPKKVIVGFDLGEDYTQISCYSYKNNEPVQISIRDGEDNYRIPTVLCLKTDTKQWLFGEEAYACAKINAGTLVEHLLAKLKQQEEINILNTRFTAQDLMEKFLRRTLTLVKNYFPTEPITKLVLTVKNSEPFFTDKLYEALALLGINKDRAVVINRSDAYLYYALSQDKALWFNDVGLFDFGEDGLNYYQIHINRRFKPMIADISKTDYTDIINYEVLKQKNCNPAYILENTAKEALYKQMISALYFTGSGFEGGWADTAIKSLCTGRRIFAGQNLYTTGACYAARELSGDRQLNDILLLTDDMVTSTISIRVYKDTRYMEMPLLEAGELWYKSGKSLEVIPEGDAVLELVQKDLLTRDMIRQQLKPDRIPKRPDRVTRLKIDFICKNKSMGEVRITDLGFGEFYPGTGISMEFSIKL